MPRAVPTLRKPQFEPLPKQAPFMYSTKAINLLSGAVRAGKTRLLVEKILADALKYPGLKIGVFRKIRATLLETTIRSFLCDACGWQNVDDDSGSYGIVTRKHWQKSVLKMTFPNNAEVQFFGIDNLTKLGGLEFGEAFIDEAYELIEDDFSMVQTRRSQKGDWIPQTFMATNPGNPLHWLFQNFVKSPPDNSLVIKTKTTDNIYLSKEFLAELDRLTGTFRLRMVEGEWVGFAGVIYDCFNEQRHVIDSLPRGDHFNIRSIDFGGNNPHTCQWWRVYREPIFDGRKRAMVLYREVYWSGISVKEFAGMINGNQPSDEKIRWTVADHDVSDRLTLRENGIQTIPAQKDVKLGIEKMYQKLANNEMYFYRDALVDADPKLIDTSGAIRRKRPQCMLDEIVGYEWNVTKNGIAKDEPVNIDNHSCDSGRYACMSVENNIHHRRYAKGRGI